MNHTQAWCWHAPPRTGPAHPHPADAPPQGPTRSRRQPIIAFNWWTGTHRTGSSPLAARPCARRRWHGHLGGTGGQCHHLRPGTRVAYHTDLRHGGTPSPHPGAGSRPDAGARCPRATSGRRPPCPGLTAWQALAVNAAPARGGPAHRGWQQVEALLRASAILPLRRGPSSFALPASAPPPVAQTARRAVGTIGI